MNSCPEFEQTNRHVSLPVTRYHFSLFLSTRFCYSNFVLLVNSTLNCISFVSTFSSFSLFVLFHFFIFSICLIPFLHFLYLSYSISSLSLSFFRFESSQWLSLLNDTYVSSIDDQHRFFLSYDNFIHSLTRIMLLSRWLFDYLSMRLFGHLPNQYALW